MNQTQPEAVILRIVRENPGAKFDQILKLSEPLLDASMTTIAYILIGLVKQGLLWVEPDASSPPSLNMYFVPTQGQCHDVKDE